MERFKVEISNGALSVLYKVGIVLKESVAVLLGDKQKLDLSTEVLIILILPPYKVLKKVCLSNFLRRQHYNIIIINASVDKSNTFLSALKFFKVFNHYG